MSFGGSYTRTPGSYDFNGMLVAPTDFGTNPYGDPSDDQNPSQALAVQWQNQHQGNAEEVGSDFSPNALRLYLASMVASGGGTSPSALFGGGGAGSGGGVGAAELGGAAPGTSALASAGSLTAPAVGVPASLPGGAFLSAEGVPLMAGEAAGVTGGTGATAAQLAGGGTLSRLGQALTTGGRMIGAAEQANAANQGLQNDYGLRAAQSANEWAQNMAQLQAQNNALGLSGYNANVNAALGVNNANTTGQSAFQNELINRSKLEQDQRANELKNLFKMSAAKNPSRGPFDRQGPPALDPQYISTLQALGQQASDALGHGPTYDAATMTAPTWTPMAAPPTYTAPTFTPPTYTAPPAWQGPNTGTLAQIGNWAGPALGLLGAYYGH